MAGGIYIVRGESDLVEMSEQPYDSEDLLQRLLARFPNLLAGDLIDGDRPRRWLLVDRELGVPSEDGGGNRWAVDHLFLDQDGVPTIVEVKRSSDTRIRREVLGQMLEYAANALRYWPPDSLRLRFEARCAREGLDHEQTLFASLGQEAGVETFWQSVSTNLQAGRVRLLFVADMIPPELRQVVEFLNEQMNPAEVLALEIRQFVGGEMRTLVPRLFGESKGRNGPRPQQWDESRFFTALAQRGVEGVVVARNILEWAQRLGASIWWGSGTRSGSFVPVFKHHDREYQPFAVWTYGTLEICFQWYAYRPPFDDEAKRPELLERLNGIEGVNLSDDAIGKRPGIPLSLFSDEAKLHQLFGVYEWFLEQARSI